jgi:hypothetical protein
MAVSWCKYVRFAAVAKWYYWYHAGLRFYSEYIYVGGSTVDERFKN